MVRKQKGSVLSKDDAVGALNQHPNWDEATVRQAEAGGGDLHTYLDLVEATFLANLEAKDSFRSHHFVVAVRNSRRESLKRVAIKHRLASEFIA